MPARSPAHSSSRNLSRTGRAVGAVSSTTWAGQAATGTSPTEEEQEELALREPILVGANPGLQLFDASGACTAYLSTWVVDWSTHGSGNAMVLWQPTGVDVIGEHETLALWLANYFVRHFPELDGLPWSTPRHNPSRVHVSIDLARGMYARGGNISARLHHVLDRRTFATDGFALDGVPHSLSLVLGPCGKAQARVHGRVLPGQIDLAGTPERPSSSAFLTEAEVWRR